MRLLLAFATFLVGFSLTAVGVVEQIDNQPISEIRVEYAADITEPYLLLPNRLLTAYPGNPHLTIQGSGELVVAQTRESDARAWLGGLPFRELRLVVDVPSEQAKISYIAKSGVDLATLRDSDIWATEIYGDNRVAFTVPLVPELALVVATDGVGSPAASVQLVWTLEPVNYPIAPIIWIGLVIMLLGATLAAIFFVVTRRRMGPRRLRPPPRPRRSGPVGRAKSQVVGPRRSGRRARGLAMLAAPLLLAGCAVEYENPILSPNPSPAPEGLTSSLTVEQAGRVLREVALVVGQADAELNREQLEARVTGPALEMRGAAYNLARRSSEIVAPDAILAEPIQLLLPAATDTWPRHLMAVTGNPPETTLQLLVLRQEGPRENYQLWHYSELLPDVRFPEVAAAEIGAASLRVDNRFLSFPVTDLVRAVGELLNDSANSSFADVIERQNPYLREVSAVQRALVENLDNADIEFLHEQGDERIVLLSTVTGGALVALQMIDVYRIVPRDVGDAVAISGPESLLLGASGSVTGVQSRYGAMLLFYVPALNSAERIQLLGATQQLLSVTTLD
jgi:hypothetical protein